MYSKVQAIAQRPQFFQGTEVENLPTVSYRQRNVALFLGLIALGGAGVAAGYGFPKGNDLLIGTMIVGITLSVCSFLTAAYLNLEIIKELEAKGKTREAQHCYLRTLLTYELLPSHNFHERAMIRYLRDVSGIYHTPEFSLPCTIFPEALAMVRLRLPPELYSKALDSNSKFTVRELYTLREAIGSKISTGEEFERALSPIYKEFTQYLTDLCGVKGLLLVDSRDVDTTPRTSLDFDAMREVFATRPDLQKELVGTELEELVPWSQKDRNLSLFITLILMVGSTLALAYGITIKDNVLIGLGASMGAGFLGGIWTSRKLHHLNCAIRDRLEYDLADRFMKTVTTLSATAQSSLLDYLVETGVVALQDISLSGRAKAYLGRLHINNKSLITEMVMQEGITQGLADKLLSPTDCFKLTIYEMRELYVGMHDIYQAYVTSWGREHELPQTQLQRIRELTAVLKDIFGEQGFEKLFATLSHYRYILAR